MSAREWTIVKCDTCRATLVSPFVPHPHDPDGLGTFAVELATELGVASDEISTTDIARAWARTFRWKETDDGWLCPAHAIEVSSQ